MDRRAFVSTALGGAAALCTARAPAQDAELEKVAGEYLTPAAQKAIAKGLAFLASRQKDDGSFGDAGYSRNTAVCALAGMAFMSSGSTPGRGPYGGNVDRCLDFILAHTENSGFINVEGATTHGPMYGHGFATLFLAEAYGMTLRADIREKLSKAVQLIVQTQNREGGWRYQPVRQDADISVTICQVMA
ncbi:MAG: terpene cyclase/mutase family protein, partial [Planctomycetaceae bacterium]|nr:terpene cyclase/mutase family protein [Planctomycetaceae bacterium]